MFFDVVSDIRLRTDLGSLFCARTVVELKPEIGGLDTVLSAENKIW